MNIRRISEKTETQLKSEEYCFHVDCRQTFNRDKIIITRKRKAADAEEEERCTKQMTPT